MLLDCLSHWAPNPWALERAPSPGKKSPLAPMSSWAITIIIIIRRRRSRSRRRRRKRRRRRRRREGEGGDCFELFNKVFHSETLHMLHCKAITKTKDLYLFDPGQLSYTACCKMDNTADEMRISAPSALRCSGGFWLPPEHLRPCTLQIVNKEKKAKPSMLMIFKWFFRVVELVTLLTSFAILPSPGEKEGEENGKASFKKKTSFGAQGLNLQGPQQPYAADEQLLPHSDSGTEPWSKRRSSLVLSWYFGVFNVFFQSHSCFVLLFITMYSIQLPTFFLSSLQRNKLEHDIKRNEQRNDNPLHPNKGKDHLPTAKKNPPAPFGTCKT